jgi:chorismate dehydratase
VTAHEGNAKDITQHDGTSTILRVGSVPYLVGRPLDLGLEDEPGIRLERAVPARLVEGLRSGALDVALVSSIELFREPGYRYLADLAVSGRGSVASVQVFLRKSIEEVRTIALDPSSRAAATLVRVLLTNKPGAAPSPGATPSTHATPSTGAEPSTSLLRNTLGAPSTAVTPEFVEIAPGADLALAGTDAFLEIGDPALRRALAPGAPPAFNPSAEWCERTGLPFVFATWIVREGVQLSPAHLDAFARSRARGAARLPELAEQASREWRVPLAACRRYLFDECVYDPGPDMERALFAFRDAAAALGLCRADLAPTSIAVPSAQLT